MKRYLFVSFPSLSLCQKNAVTGRTLQDCLQVASMFDNTCDSTESPIDLSSHAGQQLSCSGAQRCPEGQGESEQCSWTRKLCVTCSEEAGKVMIRVQSNSLPNHCFYSAVNNPTEVETDWKVEFNPNVQDQNYSPPEVDLGISGCGSGTYTDSGKTRKVLSIIIDGMRPDAILEADTPTFDELMATGLYSLEARTQMKETTYSGAGWSSVFRGVGSYKHLIDGNGIGNYEKGLVKYKTFLWYAKHVANLKTAAVVNWTDLYTHLIEPGATDYIRSASDAEGVQNLEDILKYNDFDLIFWGNDDVDARGHGYGFDPSVPEYIDAIETKDAQLRRLMDAIDARATRQDEEWLIAITSDHGGTHAGHGPKNEPNRKVSLFLLGDSLKSGLIPVDCEVDHSQMDIFPSIMEWLRIPVRSEWEIDGKSRLQYKLQDSQMCDLKETKPSILLSGAYTYSANDAENIESGTELHLDQCFARSTRNGRFHYELWSPCASANGSASTSVAPSLCNDDAGCASDKASFGMETGFTYNEPEVIGLARDGHLLYAPSGLEIVASDSCNGHFIGDNYIYVSQPNPPYTVACFGPPPADCGIEWDHIF